MEISVGSNFKPLKRSYNLWKLEEIGLIEEIQETSIPEAIILFGSYSRGEDGRFSIRDTYSP